MTTQSNERPSSTYWALVEAAAHAHPDREVLSDGYGRALTTAEVRDAALRTAAALAAEGVSAATVVSWQLPTTLETMVVMVALTRLSAVQNPIIPSWREREVRHATEQLGADVFIVPRTWRGFDHARLARTLADDRDLTTVVLDFDAAPVRGALRLPVGEPARLGAEPSVGERTAWIYFSSGTTSAPKGIQHSDASVIAGSSGIVDMLGPVSNDVNPIAFPISHIGGAATLAAALRTGMRLVLFDVFDAATTPFAIAECHPTLLGSATPFFSAYLSAQERHGAEPLFPHLRGCTGGGAPITAELGRRVRSGLSVPGVANAWGLTEFPLRRHRRWTHHSKCWTTPSGGRYREYAFASWTPMSAKFPMVVRVN